MSQSVLKKSLPDHCSTVDHCLWVQLTLQCLLWFPNPNAAPANSPCFWKGRSTAPGSHPTILIYSNVIRGSFLGMSVCNVHTCVYINAYTCVCLYNIHYVYMHIYYTLYTQAHICVYINISLWQSDNSFFRVEGCGEKQDEVHGMCLRIKNCNIDEEMKTVGLWP